MTIHKRIFDIEGNEVHSVANLDAQTADEKLEDILDNSLTMIQKKVTKGTPDRTLVDFIKVTLQIKDHLEQKKNGNVVNINVQHFEEKSTEQLLLMAAELASTVK